jgi:carbon monoxide dehydrogenase subunit G
MRLQGMVTINAARERVWAFLTDPHQVSQCVPGVESVEVVEPGGMFRGAAAVGFGSIKARFTGEAQWLDLEAPRHARVKAHGNAPGSAADVVAEMTLTDATGGGTDLSWAAEVNIAGQLASLAGRLMGSVSQRLVGQFFDGVRKRVETAETEQAAPLGAG